MPGTTVYRKPRLTAGFVPLVTRFRWRYTPDVYFVHINIWERNLALLPGTLHAYRRTHIFGCTPLHKVLLKSVKLYRHPSFSPTPCKLFSQIDNHINQFIQI